jgi:LemA protein
MLTWIVLGIVVLALLYFVGTYNGLIRLRNRVDEAESDIDVQLKRRYELIPNLVNTVKGYAKHEKELLEKITAERANLVKGSTSEKIQASNQITDALKSVFAVAENYPDLKANTNFLELQNELVDSQDKIMSAQRFYNGNVRDFNTKLQVFPTNLYAQSLGFKPYGFIEAGENEKGNVNVEF